MHYPLAIPPSEWVCGLLIFDDVNNEVSFSNCGLFEI